MSNQKSSAKAVRQVWVVDRVQEQMASVEVNGGQVRDVPLWMLPSGVSEGDVFRVDCEQRHDRSVITIVADEAEKRRRLERSREQVSKRSRNDPGGDIVL